MSKINDQVDIRLIALENYAYDKAEKLKKLQTQVETLQEFNKNAEKVLSRIDTSLEELEENYKLLEQYTVKGLTDSLRDLEYKIELKLERIDDILVSQRNKTDTQRKNYNRLIEVIDEKVKPLIEGTHGK